MKKIIIIASAVTAGLFTPLSNAQSSATNSALARQAFSDNGCNACHESATRVVGPALQEIAKHYKGKKVAAEVAARIRNGSLGRWGDIPHPVYEAMDEKTAEMIAAWILAGSPQ